MSELHEYTEEFFEYIERGSTASARRFSAFMTPLLDVNSILDVGCGRGAWLREWRNAGVKVVHGADGPYVRRESLLIPAEDFTAVDLSQKFDLGRRYDLVSSLEVAEHLPPSASEAFISSLVGHSDLILFSAATPGQGGENHINERPLWYWQGVFAEHGYVAFDALRPHFQHDPLVEPWYRYNSLLYASTARIATLPPSVLATRVLGNRVKEIGDLKWHVRRSLLRLLPNRTVTTLSRWNYRRLNKAYRAGKKPTDTA
jgi:cyclopropane fatty-acyl-phospholipid synthase-like methyltransferase